MIERFVVRNKDTGFYVGEKWRFWEADEEGARIYKSRRAAACSMSRKRLSKTENEIVPVTFTFSAKDKWKVPNLNGVVPIEFHNIAEYMRRIMQVDITGNYRSEFQLSLNILDVFFNDNRFLSGMPNGSTFIISEKTFVGESGLHLMVGNEILRTFGFDEEGRRIAAFVVDWWNDDGEFIPEY